MFQGCFTVFQGSFKGVPRKFLGCFNEVSRVFQGRLKGCFKEVLSGFQGSLREFPRFFKDVSRKF